MEATRVDRILKSKEIVRMSDLKPPPKEFWDLNKRTVTLTLEFVSYQYVRNLFSVCDFSSIGSFKVCGWCR